MHGLISVLFLSILLFGCAAPVGFDQNAADGVRILNRSVGNAELTQRSRARAALTDSQRVTLTDDQNASIRKEVQETMRGCALVLNRFENSAERGAKWAFWLHMSGLIAGAVFAPAAIAASTTNHAVAIAAASGWAGATNLAGESLRTAGLSGSAAAEVRNQIAADFRAQMAIALNTGNDYQARLDAVLAANAACMSYAVFVPGAMPRLPEAEGTKKGAEGEKKPSDGGESESGGGSG